MASSPNTGNKLWRLGGIAVVRICLQAYVNIPYSRPHDGSLVYWRGGTQRLVNSRDAQFVMAGGFLCQVC
jgi:hypothetical protein